MSRVGIVLAVGVAALGAVVMVVIAVKRGGANSAATGASTSASLAPVPSALAAAAPAVHPPGALDVSTLLPPGSTSFLPAGSVEAHLQGTPSTAGYDGVRYARPGSADLGLAIQWWRLSSASEAQSRYDKNRAGSGSGVRDSDELGTHSFRATGYQRRSLVFVDAPSSSVVALSCGDQTCVGAAGDAQLLALAKAMDSRLAAAH